MMWKIALALLLSTVLSLGLAKCQADRAHKAEVNRDFWKGRAIGWNKAYVAAEKLRKKEQQRAVTAISEEQGACDARVAEARRSSRTIRQIVTREVPVDANNCPVRSVIDTDSLRNALQPSR